MESTFVPALHLLDARKENLTKLKDKEVSFSWIELFTEIDMLVDETKLQFPQSELFLVKSLAEFGQRRVFKGDVHQILRIVGNLVNNSIEAKRNVTQQVKVKIQLCSDSASAPLKIKVVDNGMGMNFETVAALMQGKEYTTKESGNGIGISRAKLYVESIGGEFRINSKVEWGTVVHIQIPADKS